MRKERATSQGKDADLIPSQDCEVAKSG